MTALPTPAEVMAFLDTAATELDDLGKRLESAHVSYGDAEAAWEEARDFALVELVQDHYKQTPDRALPGEDVRLALARKRVGFQVYRDYLKAKALVKALENHSRKLEKALSARQSTLKGIREAMATEGYGKPGDTYGGRP